MNSRWIYNTADRVWELYVSGRRTPIYNTAVVKQPDDEQTARIMQRLTTCFPWLKEELEAAA